MGQFKCVNISTVHAAALVGRPAYYYAPLHSYMHPSKQEQKITFQLLTWSEVTEKLAPSCVAFPDLIIIIRISINIAITPSSSIGKACIIYIIRYNLKSPSANRVEQLPSGRSVGRLGSLRIRCWISLKYALIVLNNGIRATFASRLFEAVQIASEAYPPTANFQAFTAKWSWGSGSSTTDTGWHCQGIVSANANKNPAEDVVQLRIYNSTVQFLAVLLLLKWH